MNLLFVVLAVLIAVVVLAALIAKKNGDSSPKTGTGERPTKRPVLTEREQAMHNRLTQSVPDLIVLAQVSFSALLNAKTTATRNTFDRKTADFVICDRAFQVLAVIELDDASHRSKKSKDGDRDAMLRNAGYRVIRYANIPDIEKVRQDFAPAPITAISATPSPTDRLEPTLD